MFGDFSQRQVALYIFFDVAAALGNLRREGILLQFRFLYFMDVSIHSADEQMPYVGGRSEAVHLLAKSIANCESCFRVQPALHCGPANQSDNGDKCVSLLMIRI